MLSWVSGMHRSNRPPWYEHEISLSISTTEQQQEQHQETKKRKLVLFPKLRKAIEAAKHASNGSFPIQETIPPPSPAEETAFEACDSISQCSQLESLGGASCSTLASYDMSRIDEDGNFSLAGMEASDSVAPSPTASDVDSLFGVNIRDMATFQQSIEERDDVWLLSNKDENRVAADVPREVLKSPGASILSRVPVLVLPGLPDRQMIPIQHESHSTSTVSNWQEDAEDEEEIEFDDSTFLISETEENFNNENNRDSDDENRNSNIMMRAQILGKKVKGIWSSSDCGKRVKLAKRRYRQGRKTKPKLKPKPSPSMHSIDPLKELSKCHERMLGNDQPFSPKRAFSQIRNRIRRDNDTLDSSERQHSVLLSFSSSVSSADEPSEISLPSELFPSISASTTLTLDPSPSVNDCPNEKPVGLITESQSSEAPSLNQATPVQEDLSKQASQEQPKPPPTFKIKFKSPRNDTPRIVLDNEASTSLDSADEPRALYTDEGYVDAYIHPKDSGSRSMDSRNSLNHVFHSELSTLYEVSSSLESASFSTASGSAASTEATSMCATAGNSRTGVPLHAASTSTTTSDGSSTTHQDTKEDPSHVPNNKDFNSNLQHKSDEASHAQDEGVAHMQGCFVDDREVKMRWEFSLGLIQDQEQALWRQATMPLMTTEEMAHDYVAEI